MTPLDELVCRGRYIAFETAAQCVETMGVQDKVHPEKFARVLERHFKKEFPRALKDAQAAWNDGLEEVASITFDASMKLAGVRAVNEYLG